MHRDRWDGNDQNVAQYARAENFSFRHESSAVAAGREAASAGIHPSGSGADSSAMGAGTVDIAGECGLGEKVASSYVERGDRRKIGLTGSFAGCQSRIKCLILWTVLTFD